MEATIVDLLKEFGLPVCLVVFFVVRDWKRETRMALRIDGLENEIRDILAKALVDSTSAIVKNTDVLVQLVGLLQRIPCLPCVMKDEGKIK